MQALCWTRACMARGGRPPGGVDHVDALLHSITPPPSREEAKAAYAAYLRNQMTAQTATRRRESDDYHSRPPQHTSYRNRHSPTALHRQEPARAAPPFAAPAQLNFSPQPAMYGGPPQHDPQPLAPAYAPAPNYAPNMMPTYYASPGATYAPPPPQQHQQFSPHAWPHQPQAGPPPHWQASAEAAYGQPSHQVDALPAVPHGSGGRGGEDTSGLLSFMSARPADDGAAAQRKAQYRC